MEFFVMSTVAVIFSAGILTLTPLPESWTYRLPAERGSGAAFLRKTLLKAAAVAGQRAARLRTAKRQELIQKELYSALSVLRNHASADGCAESTTDHLLEQFSQADGILKDIYDGALRLLRTGKRSAAAEYFAAAAGVDLARDFILLVLDWDAVPPHKLRKTVSAFQSALRETRTTELMRKNEVLSDLVYLPVVTGVLIVFVNFIYVAYFAEQSALLAELFF
jgi:hypothetical protein